MWLFFLMINSMIPLMTLVIGILFYYKPPKKINYVYGYRTTLSMKTKETWDYAHYICGKVWIGLGVLMIFLTALESVIASNELSNMSDDNMALIVLVQVSLMIGSILIVEISLRKRFDKDGNRKNQ